MVNKLQKDLTNKRKRIFYVLGVLAGVSLFFYVGMFAYGKYIEYKSDKIESQLLENQKILKNYKKDSNYQKYQKIKYIRENENNISWLNTINKLISVYDDVRSLGSDNIVLDSFGIDIDTIRLSGKINEIQDAYSQGGLIDRFVDLEFIEYVSIPGYSQKNGDYNFDLEAKIQIKGINK